MVDKPKIRNIKLADDAANEDIYTHTHKNTCQDYGLEIETYKRNPKYCV